MRRHGSIVQTMAGSRPLSCIAKMRRPAGLCLHQRSVNRSTCWSSSPCRRSSQACWARHRRRPPQSESSLNSMRVTLSYRALLKVILVRAVSWFELHMGPRAMHFTSREGKSATTGSRKEPDRWIGKVTWSWRSNTASTESKEACIQRWFRSLRAMALSHK